MQAESEKSTQGIIFNIQHYCIHDGPGIRTTVFLKGCPLRCLWCQNPESQKLQPEVLFSQEKCSGCGVCVTGCPEGAIKLQEGVTVSNRQVCTGQGKCTELCPNQARSLVGRKATAGEVFDKVFADKIFYQRSGGGMTLSGGEPLAQPEFAISLLSLCKEAGINTALETSGYANWETMSKVLEHVDLVLYDLKHLNSEEHAKLTGVPNQLILDNLKRIYHQLELPIIARIPVIPGHNDSLSNLEATAKFIAEELSDSVKVHLLPYHRLGETKNERLERSNQGFTTEIPSEEHLLSLQQIFKAYNLPTQVGG